METKSLMKSKIVWFNGLTILVTLATFFGYTPNQELSGQVTTFLLLLAPVVNLLLRFITTQGLTFRKFW
mgnify:CR=1 FL=1